jgi:hypothetical protein
MCLNPDRCTAGRHDPVGDLSTGSTTQARCSASAKISKRQRRVAIAAPNGSPGRQVAYASQFQPAYVRADSRFEEILHRLESGLRAN